VPITEDERRLRARDATKRHREKRFREIDAMPKIPCACGCGEKIAPINKTLQPARFARGHNRPGKQTEFRKGQNMGPLNVRWSGGSMNHGTGYIKLLVGAEHPMANERGYVFAHRLVMSEAIGRPLRSSEQVHHINGDRSDNRLENLQLLQRFHGTGGAYRCCDCGSHNVEPAQLKEG
jgi:hypothetical protein